MVTLTTLRLFLHVMAASIWVGGQIVLAGLVPTARELAPDGPARAARAFNRLAWPAYGVAVATGIWNLLAVPMSALQHPQIEIKVTVVALSGIGAFLHQRARGNRLLLAVGGAMAGGFAVLAVWFGIAVVYRI